MNLYVILIDRRNAYLVKDLSIEEAVKRIINQVGVTESIKIMSIDDAMKLTDFNVLQIHSCEIGCFTLYD